MDVWIYLLILFFCFSILACNCSYFTINEELEKIAANLRKDDNPVLMVMKFGKELNLR